MQTTPDICLFLGRFHPLLVHLPIGFLVLLAALETLSRSRRFECANASAGYILALLVPTVWSSALCGWLLSGSDDYDVRLLQVHRAFGFATALLCTWMAVCHNYRWKRLYATSLCVNTLVLGVASHFGGSLTQGSDYLVRYAPGPLRGIPEQRRAFTHGESVGADHRVFTLTVQPILQRRCRACHNSEKRKGGLCLDALADLLRGGKNGPVILPGDAVHSPLLERLLLPLEDEDHMPPVGKPQPAAEEVALLRAWIDGSAAANLTPPPDGDVKPKTQLPPGLNN